MTQKHEEKVHFIPIRYHVFSGIIQGLNIKFGNFIEQLIRNVVEIDPNVEVMPDSGKTIELFFTPQTDALINAYITERQLPNSLDDCTSLFDNLLHKIIKIEALKRNFRVLAKSTHRLLNDLQIARANGTHLRMLARILACDLLVLDDFELQSISPQAAQDLYEIIT